ncbi:MAG: GIY-YIG nuclease family protein [Ignavibacteriaceae bacterium]|nr:GIY-YIG nuclease family protein [Ignavibacteriaceae bacterium]
MPSGEPTRAHKAITKAMAFYACITESGSGKHYIGYTSKLEQSLSRHNRNHHGFSYRKAEQWEIIVSKEYGTKAEAMRVEKHLK